MKRLLLFFVIAFSISSWAQLPAGTWRTHLAYTSVTQVAETPTKVFGLSDGALFAYDKTAQTTNVYTKVQGMHDNTVTLIAYSAANDILMIVYDNANIDLMTGDGKFYNLPEIKNNNLALNKTINKIHFDGNTAYVSTAYGITAINLTKREVSNTYFLNKKVYATAVFNGSLYAATDQGILTASTTASLSDPNNWAIINPLKAVDLAVFQNTLLAVVTATGLYSVTPSSYQLIKSSTVLTNLFVANNILVVYGLSQLSFYTSLTQETSVAGTNYYGLSALNPAITTWHAASGGGVNRIDKGASSYTKVTMNLKPNGPFANSPYKLRFSGDKLMVVGGGAYFDRYNTAGMMMFYSNNQWSYFRLDTIKAQGSTVRDLNDIVEDPRESGHYFVTSYGEGVYEFRNNKFVKLNDHTNSGIETVNLAVLKGVNHFDRTYGLCYDKDNNLFVTNCFTANIIKILKNDGTWTSLYYPLITNNEAIFDIFQSKNGIYWALSPWKNPGVFVFNPNGTFANAADDQSKLLSTITYDDNGITRSITPGSFYCMKEDNNGDVWIGTDQGPIILKNTSTIFSSNYLASRVKHAATLSNPIASYLLEDDIVRSICVDKANRKWIGTEASGVYLLSADGLQTIFHFTVDNSPLVSNKILSMDIHPTTGEIFIGTDKGLVSYKNDALSTGTRAFSEVYATPNPVRPEYEGDVAIHGLKSETSVKITDLKGNIVFEGTSVEDQITWDKKDKSGVKVATGIYLVYASTSSSLEELVTKIMIVK